MHVQSRGIASSLLCTGQISETHPMLVGSVRSVRVAQTRGACSGGTVRRNPDNFVTCARPTTLHQLLVEGVRT
jgi:hypothetical protein